MRGDSGLPVSLVCGYYLFFAFFSLVYSAVFYSAVTRRPPSAIRPSAAVGTGGGVSLGELRVVGVVVVVAVSQLGWRGVPRRNWPGGGERGGPKRGNRAAGSLEDAAGGISADGQVGTDDAGSSEGRGGCEVLVGVGAKVLAIVCGEALDDAGFEEVEAGFRDAANSRLPGVPSLVVFQFLTLPKTSDLVFFKPTTTQMKSTLTQLGPRFSKGFKSRF